MAGNAGPVTTPPVLRRWGLRPTCRAQRGRRGLSAEVISLHDATSRTQRNETQMRMERIHDGWEDRAYLVSTIPASTGIVVDVSPVQRTRAAKMPERQTGDGLGLAVRRTFIDE